jgi:hypothetical protein
MKSYEDTAQIDGSDEPCGAAQWRLWLSPLVGAVLYPWLIGFFGGAIDGYRQTGNVLLAAAASLVMLLAASVPAFAARALILVRQDCEIDPVVTRSFLYLMFAVSPMYVLTLQIIGMLGATRYKDLIWVVCWIAMGATLLLQPNGRAPGPDRIAGSGLRMIHGAAAMCLLLVFLIAHLVNHGLAIWSVKLHGVAMEWLRVWYRSEWLEPVLLTLLAVMIATGVPMVVQHSRRRADAFRIAQMATGVYLGLFLCAHVVAVLGARNAGIETDWRFATGASGLLNGRGMLIPYYIYATFFMAVHVGCGLRIVLVKHGVAETIANKAVYTITGTGAVVSTLIAIAALGFHVKNF